MVEYLYQIQLILNRVWKRKSCLARLIHIVKGNAEKHYSWTHSEMFKQQI